MATLHVQWMDLPGPTDVMSFPMDELRPTRDEEEPAEGLLGDIVICPQVASRQAADAGHAVEDELALLLTHGILHLLGFDHAEPEEHAEMFALQAELLDAWAASRTARRARCAGTSRRSTRRRRRLATPSMGICAGASTPRPGRERRATCASA